ncbi:MAG: dephospho-CoA kinase, partial [Anaerolineae bacterium]|nr:dephospho-CoA kinase [Anaerolineae bacterium]
VKRSDKYVVVVEAIKLVEGELANQVDSIWVVDSSPENQIKRLVEKRGMSVDTAKRRVMLQNPQKEKLSRANVVITNNETPEKTWLQVQAAWRNIPGLPQEKETQTVATVTVEPTPPQPPVTPVSTLATAVPTPQPPAATPPLAITSFDVKRPQPKDFDKIAALINKVKGTSLDRNDIMAHFGEKTYLLAESNNTPLGVIAYLVENLITRVDEFVVEPAAPAQAVGQSLIKAMEESAEELQSEVVFVFLSHHVESVKPIFEKSEYQETSVESIQYPIWREAVKESKPQGASIFSKRLREKPIQVPI